MIKSLTNPDLPQLLDIGCGRSKAPGSYGVDQFQLPGVDLVCNLNEQWPLDDASFDHVVFRHSIVHLNSLEHALREARRVLRKGGTVEIVSPHFSSDNAFTDPTMNFSTGWRTLDFYCSNGATLYGYYGQTGLRLKHKRIHLYRSKIHGVVQHTAAALFWPVEFIINLMPRVYEKYLCFLIRGNEVRYILEAE